MLNFTSTLSQGPDFFSKLERQVPYATSLALNRTAEAVREAIGVEMQRVFDRPTPYTQRALRIQRANKGNLSAHVGFKNEAGKGTPADKYLWPQVHGGSRSQKRSEKALDRIGLPRGYVVPGAGAEIDAYGNMSRGQIVRLLSYLQAFGEQGYRANSTSASRARQAKMSGPNMRRKSEYVTINGRVYFMSKGPGSVSGNRTQHLPAGVWEKKGTHGADIKPVLLAVDTPTYTPLLPFYETADDVFGERFDAEYASALDQALATAR